jgi:hypothetical protein
MNGQGSVPFFYYGQVGILVVIAVINDAFNELELLLVSGRKKFHTRRNAIHLNDGLDYSSSFVR